MPMQYVDPMAVSSRRDPGSYIMQGTGILSQLLTKLPEAIKMDVQTKNDTDFKKDLSDTAMEGLRKIGVDPATVKLPDFSDERITKEQYTEQLANILAPYAEGQGARLTPELFKSLGMSQNPNVQENLQRQGLLEEYDPMSRLDFSKMQTTDPNKQPQEQVQGPALPEGSRSSYDPMSGTSIDAGTGQTNIAPQPQKFDADTMLGMVLPSLTESLKNKDISPEKFSDKILDLKIMDKKIEMDKQKAENDYWRELLKSGASTGRGIVDPKTGKETVVTKDNYNDVGMGGAMQRPGGRSTNAIERKNDFVKFHGREPGFDAEGNPMSDEQFEKDMRWIYNYNLSDPGIDQNTKKVGAAKTAQNLAPKPLSEKETTTLEGMKQQYTNTNNAATKFNNDFVAPYLGRGIKLAWLRQNDPKFAEFMSPLALALNKYRVQNFGTAQTQSEINNFLDVINTDMNVSVDVFKAQLGSLLSSIERDYNDMITTRKQQKKVVPSNLDDVEIPPEPVDNDPLGIR